MGDPVHNSSDNTLTVTVMLVGTALRLRLCPPLSVTYPRRRMAANLFSLPATHVEVPIVTPTTVAARITAISDPPMAVESNVVT